MVNPVAPQKKPDAIIREIDEGGDKAVVHVNYSLKDIAQRVQPVAERYSISEIYLFGSHARGVASETSDIDVLIKRSGSTISSAFDLGGVLLDLQEALGKKVDLVTLESLDTNSTRRGKRHFSQALNDEKVLIYAKH